ncbi:hypothetical protein H9P43_005229 [Blastocladiella emersonii ATCC 22665]|nr:hypothetical protein H9P43_005229 [Blastocladiella emersonii ATCC 22665]
MSFQSRLRGLVGGGKADKNDKPDKHHKKDKDKKKHANGAASSVGNLPAASSDEAHPQSHLGASSPNLLHAGVDLPITADVNAATASVASRANSVDPLAADSGPASAAASPALANHPLDRHTSPPPPPPPLSLDDHAAAGAHTRASTPSLAGSAESLTAAAAAASDAAHPPLPAVEVDGKAPAAAPAKEGKPGKEPKEPKDKHGKGKLSKWKDMAIQKSEKWMVKASEMRHHDDPKHAHHRGGKKGGLEEHAVAQRVFCAPLELAVAASQIDETCPLPAVVIRCIEYLEGRGMYEVGLYRIPGSTSTVTKLKGVYDHGVDLDLFLEDPPVDPHAVATLLKLFLREMPENLLADHLPHFTHLVATERDPLPLLAALARQLPLPNYYLLSWLCAHLARLAYYADVNKMTLNNLALIFCPTLQLDSQLFSVLVEHSVELFPLTEDGAVPDAIYRGPGSAPLEDDDAHPAEYDEWAAQAEMLELADGGTAAAAVYSPATAPPESPKPELEPITDHPHRSSSNFDLHAEEIDPSLLVSVRAKRDANHHHIVDVSSESPAAAAAGLDQGEPLSSDLADLSPTTTAAPAPATGVPPPRPASAHSNRSARSGSGEDDDDDATTPRPQAVAAAVAVATSSPKPAPRPLPSPPPPDPFADPSGA